METEKIKYNATNKVNTKKNKIKMDLHKIKTEQTIAETDQGKVKTINKRHYIY